MSVVRWDDGDWRMMVAGYVAVPFLLFLGPMVFIAAGAWMFWLFMSVIVGIFQMIYVVYQLLMISMDIVFLAILKSVATFIRLVFQRPSRKRIWRTAIRQCTTYQDYLQIPIQEPKHNNNKLQLFKETSPNFLFLFPFSSFLSSNKQKKIAAGTTTTTTHKSLLHRSMSYSVFRTISSKHNEEDEDEKRLSHSLSSNEINSNKIRSTLPDIVKQELGDVQGEALVGMTRRLAQARLDHPDDMDGLEFLVASVMKRTSDNLWIENARSVVDKGTHKFSAESREIFENYNLEIEKCLQHIGNCKINASTNHHRSYLKERIKVMKKIQHNMGRTALMLSGGGAQSMYHLGTIKALCESNLYDNITVISGTSGGSITAGMCAMKTKEELLKDVCVPTVSTDYKLTGEMKKHNIRWFPTLTKMGQYWLQKRLLVDPKEFQKCCEFFFGDTTFEEAYTKTGKSVCITVTASRESSGGQQRLLLNHISTPHVTIASAVAASCALPGVMAPAKLKTKKDQLFDVDGTEWIDGSVQADLPFRRISTLFNVSNYIVCQTNFHVLPFLNKEHHPSVQSLYWRMFQTCEWDIRSRALHLSRLGLFPKIFGQDISKVFQQKYHGNLTLVPRFTTMQVFGLKSLVNPTVQDMKLYLKNGQETAWPYLTVIREMLRLETAIEKSLSRLEERLRNTYTTSTTSFETSSSFSDNEEENLTLESLLEKLKEYELEIASLKQQLQEKN